MKRPEKIAGHEVGNDGEQHQKNRDPENPTVVHSSPARSARMTVGMLVIMVSIVHRKQTSILSTLASLEKKKVRAGPAIPSRTGGSIQHNKLAFPYPVNAVEPAQKERFDV